MANLLKDTKKKSRGQQSAEVLHDSSQSHDDSPRHDQDSHVPASLVELRQEEVARDLTKYVRNEEDYEGLKSAFEQRRLRIS